MKTEIDPEIRRVHEKMKKNVDLIPIANWGFDKEVTERLKDKKHGLVNQQLTKAEKRKLKNKQKQQLARGVDLLPKKVSEVIDWAASTSLSKKNKPNPIEKSQRTTQSEEGMEIDQKREISKEEEARAKEIKEILLKKGHGKRKIKAPQEKNGKKKDEKPKLVKSDVKQENGVKKGQKILSNGTSSNSNSDNDELDEETGGYEDDVEKLVIDDSEEDSEALDTDDDETMENLVSNKSKKEFIAESGGYEDDNENLEEDSDEEPIPPKKKSKIEPQTELMDQKIILPKLTRKNANRTIELDDSQIAYSNLNYMDKDKRVMTKKDKRDKFTGKDYKRLLEKAEKREEKLGKIREKNPEKAEKIEDEIKWSKAMKRAEGQKVKDNPELLKKGLKRKLKKKEHSKKKWANREQTVEQKKATKQEKREGNIQKRKEQKQKKKLQKARKKGRIA